MKTTLLCMWFCTCYLSGIAQIGNRYNLNTQNGLPSNNVYNVLKDKYGYLWIATDNGVVKYNGYSLKIFNLHNGLPNADVWSLCEDKGGRIWLGSIANELGYINNEKYHKVIFPGMHSTLFPTNILPYGDEVIFVSPYVYSPDLTRCVVKQDTVFTDSNKYPFNYIIYNTDRFPILITGRQIDTVNILNRKFTHKKLATISNSSILKRYGRNKLIAVGKYFLLYKTGDSKVSILNSYNGSVNCYYQSRVNGVTDHLNLIYYRTDPTYNSFIYPIGNKYIYKVNLDSGTTIQQKLTIDSLVPVTGNAVAAIFEDKDWNCIATSTKGLFINYNSNNYFKKGKVILEHCKYVGISLSGASYWWNLPGHTLIVYHHGSVTKFRLHQTDYINKIVSINKDTCLMLTDNDTHYCLWLIKDRKIIPAATLNKNYGLLNTIYYNKNRIYTISRDFFSEIKLNAGYSQTILDVDRYRDLVYDTVRQNIWAYNSSKVYIHSINGEDEIIESPLFKKFGVDHLEKVLVDGYGNIFLKDDDKVIVYDPGTGKHQEILTNYNLGGTSIFIHNNILIVTGCFGVIFEKVAGGGKLFNSFLYQNIKNAYYDNISDACVTNEGVMLNTNKGVYTVPFPTDSELRKGNENVVLQPFRFLVKYNDTLYPVTGKDTIRIYQWNRSLQFDVINPKGSGMLHFQYGFSKNLPLLVMNANELNLYDVPPGKYATLYISAFDDEWRSENLSIVVYVMPYWWQTNWGKNIIYLMIFFAMVILLISAVLITRRIIVNRNKLKNKQLELELKSIYAQINPHFIFNTLGSAMLLIKQKRIDDAYEHVSKFSSLLRSYLRASQNKYIDLNDEIDNLHTYIQLQQTRFKNKFSYHIDTNNLSGTLKIPSLLLQPLVENAINHGLFHKQAEGYLYIGFTNDDNKLICVIEDDGIGRIESRTFYTSSETNKESYGSKLIDDLIEIFNSYEQLSIEINYTDKQNPTGTRVEIIIHNINQQRK